MKVISKSKDDTTYLFKVTKTEDEVIQYLIQNDDVFNQNFDVMSNGIECVIIKKQKVTVDDCVKFLNHCFANELVSQAIRGEKLKKLRDV